MQFLPTLFIPFYTFIGYNNITGQVVFLKVEIPETMPTGVSLADKQSYDILNNNIVKDDILDVYVIKSEDSSYSVAAFKLTITQNGVYPAFPKLIFKADEKRVLMIENGIVKKPADVILSVTFNKVQYQAADFAGTLLINKPDANLLDHSASFIFIDNKNKLISSAHCDTLMYIAFYNVVNAANVKTSSPLYFKSGSFKTNSLVGSLYNGYAVFGSDPSIKEGNPLQVAIGDFSASTFIYYKEIYGYLINKPVTENTRATLLFTNNQTIPQDIIVKLVEGSNEYPAKRVDDYNYLVQGDFKAAAGSYTLKIIRCGQSVLDMPINYLVMYGVVVKKANKHAAQRSQKKFEVAPTYAFNFNQLFLNYVFESKIVCPSKAEETVLLVFKKKNTGKKAEEICTLSRLNVSVNGNLVFSEETTNCTIDVKIDKSKVVQGFDLEWVWTQEGATISEGKQKLTARVVSDALSSDGFELTTKFMNQSYITGGEVAAIVVGSVAAVIVVSIIIACIFTNCKCFKAPRFQNTVYQM